jgi:hypothetical protein
LLTFYKTIIIYDQDAPYPPPNNSKSPYVHMIAANLVDQILPENIILPYVGPNPPADSPRLWLPSW